MGCRTFGIRYRRRGIEVARSQIQAAAVIVGLPGLQRALAGALLLQS